MHPCQLVLESPFAAACAIAPGSLAVAWLCICLLSLAAGMALVRAALAKGS
jgi:hypothetical protein